MKTNPDFEPDDALVDAVLRDDSWQTASSALKAEAVGAFCRRQRLRRVARWSGAVIAAAAIVIGALHWLNRPAVQPPVMAQSPTPKVAAASKYLSDEELLASFPAGSCFLAEVDGRKELVFVDPKLERLYLAGAQ